MSIDPRSDPARHARGFETLEQASQGNLRHIRALGDDHPVARKLADCHDGPPCGSGACQLCGRNHRRQLTCQLASLAEEFGGFVKVDVVSPLDQVAPGELQAVHFGRLKDRLWSQLGRPGLEGAIFVFGIDVSLNIPANGSPGIWQLHSSGIGFGTNAKAVRTILRPLYPSSESIYRPLMVGDVEVARYEDYVGALTYSFKMLFNRKVIVDGRYLQKGRGRKFYLKDDDLRELLPVLDDVGFGGRMIRRNTGRWR